MPDVNKMVKYKRWNSLKNPLNQEPYSSMIDDWLFGEESYPVICDIKHDEYMNNMRILKKISVLILVIGAVVIW